ncbi:MAG: DNA polymerase IV [Candidatus Rokuibacteriota bacterium]
MPEPGAPVRIIAHVDMDAFYAAVEERYSPDLRGRPVVVGADPKDGQGRGVVTTASYAARKYGIRSAMPISRAWRLAQVARRRGEPEAVFIRGNHRLYREVSQRIMTLGASGADAFEEASIDEAYLDLSSLGAFERAEAHARALKAAIREQEGLTCSIGIAPNKLVAKIASDFRKPDGLTVVRHDDVQAFLDPLSIRAIPGIGPKTETFLHDKRVRTVAELRQVEGGPLTEWFGKWGADLYRKARGISESPVSNVWEPKSIGEQETFEENTREAAVILERARQLAAGVFGRMVAEGFRAFRTVTVTVRFADFVTTNRSHTVGVLMTSQEALDREVLRLLLPFLDHRENPKRKEIRLLGVRVEKLVREDDRHGGSSPVSGSMMFSV